MYKFTECRALFILLFFGKILHEWRGERGVEGAKCVCVCGARLFITPVMYQQKKFRLEETAK